MNPDSFENIGEGFSSLYDEYEKSGREDFIDIARRNCIRSHVGFFLKPGHKILEINAGSGIDAVYFAQKGNPVLATDISDGSERHIKEKIKQHGLTNLQFQKCSFTALQNIGNSKFDHIFSNFGGLNCTDDLGSVFSQFDSLLNPGGYVSLVIMPPYYLWEMASVLKGNKNAFRRLRKKGTISNVGGFPVKIYYHTPKQVKNAFGSNFRHLKTRNIGAFYPSSHFTSLRKHKTAISNLIQFDDWINNFPFMIKGVGDYFIITFQKTN